MLQSVVLPMSVVGHSNTGKFTVGPNQVGSIAFLSETLSSNYVFIWHWMRGSPHIPNGNSQHTNIRAKFSGRSTLKPFATVPILPVGDVENAVQCFVVLNSRQDFSQLVKTIDMFNTNLSFIQSE